LRASPATAPMSSPMPRRGSKASLIVPDSGMAYGPQADHADAMRRELGGEPSSECLLGGLRRTVASDQRDACPRVGCGDGHDHSTPLGSTGVRPPSIEITATRMGVRSDDSCSRAAIRWRIRLTESGNSADHPADGPAACEWPSDRSRLPGTSQVVPCPRFHTHEEATTMAVIWARGDSGKRTRATSTKRCGPALIMSGRRSRAGSGRSGDRGRRGDAERSEIGFPTGSAPRG
jgi:hypothetical protein